jgi:type VI secretion system protein ImpJ
MAAEPRGRFVAPAPSERKDDDVPLRKPDWRHGLRLMPQHFQAQDRYHEELVGVALNLAFDRPWGVADLMIDGEALATGHFALRRLSAILPDGTPVICGSAGNTHVAPRSFEAELRSKNSLDVYVGLLLEIPGRPTLEDSAEGLSRRRSAEETAMVSDYNTGQNPIPIPWARPNLRLLFQDEAFEKYSVLRIAKVDKSNTGQPRLDPRFVPPVLRVRASSVLEQWLQDLDKALLTTRSALFEQRSTGPEITGVDAVRLLLLSMLGRLHPRISDMISAPSVHPREAYRVLAELVGALSAFSPTGNATVPPFDYLDLGPAFDTLISRVHEVAESLSAPKYRAIPLHRHDEHLWYVELREPGIFGKEFLLVVTGHDPATLRTHIPRLVKIAPWDELGSVIQAALPGVSVIPEARRPPGLAMPAQSACFRLSKQGPAWSNIVKKGSIGIFVPPASKQAKVSLYVQEPGVLG